MAPGLNLPPPTKDGGSIENGGPSHPIPRPKATVEDVDELTAQSAAGPSSQKPKFSSGGIIYPPPDIRSIVDKTAGFVARNGPTFEAKIKADERANTRFAFLNEADPFHAYFKAKIEAVRDGTGALAEVKDGPGSGTPDPAADSKALVRVNGGTTDADTDEEQGGLQAIQPPEPRAMIFSGELPNVTALDLDVIKLTALFVAQKGRSFSQALLGREASSYQFEFQRPQHSLFGFFNRLVEQYRLLLDPPKDVLEYIRAESGSREEKLGMGCGGSRQTVLQEARKRAHWEKWMDERRKKRQDEEEEEKTAFAEIDWQDFVVVSTVELTEQDAHIDLPAPMSLREIESMTMAQRKLASMIMEEEAVDEPEANAQVGLVDLPGPESAQTGDSAAEDAMQMADSDEDQQPQPTTLPSGRSGAAPMKIRKDYKPKTLAERQAATAQTTTCPICHEVVLTAEMAEHVRIELLNPQYRAQRAELEARRGQQAALTAGADPSQFLSRFAGNRTDIFGLQEQEAAATKREEEERQRAREKQKIVWDGHTASRIRTKDSYNRPEQMEQSMRDIQGRFVQRDTESIGPQMPWMQQPQPQYPPQDGLIPGAYDGSMTAAGTKRPAGAVEGASQQPPSQRPAYESVDGSFTPTAQPPHPAHHHGLGAYPASMGGAGSPAPPQQYPHQSSPSHGAVSLTLRLPASTEPPTVFYPSLPLSTSISSLRDRIHTEKFSSVGASRIKLKWTRQGKMLNLRMTLGEVGMGQGSQDGEGGVVEGLEEIEVIVK